MAAWNGNVHYFEPGGEHNSDNNAAVTSAVDIASVRAGVQLDMRHFDPWRAVHSLVFGRNVTGIEWSGANCYLWRNTGTCA
jgi:hypothetical protein